MVGVLLWDMNVGCVFCSFSLVGCGVIVKYENEYGDVLPCLSVLLLGWGKVLTVLSTRNGGRLNPDSGCTSRE